MTMNEKEFRALYKAKQQKISTSDSLKDAVLAQAAQENRDFSAETNTTYDTLEEPHISSGYAYGQPQVSIPSTRRDIFRAKRSWFIPAAACAAVALTAVLCAPMALNILQEPLSSQAQNLGDASYSTTSTQKAAPSQSANPLFNVCAYATPLDSFVPAEDGRIYFSKDASMSLQAAATNDWYPGFVFALDGEGIERIQATLSTGELCRYTFEDLKWGQDQEKITELLSWKPTARGFGEYYSSLDYVGAVPVTPELDRTDPNFTIQSRLVKRYGSTIDIDMTATDSFIMGMWFDASNYPLAPDGSVDIAALDGETLTLTAQFADGSSQTQVVELHKGTFKLQALDYNSSTAEDAIPAGEPLAEVDGQYVDEAGTVVDEYDTVTTLYGEIVSTTNEPHPYSLENANEHANAVVAVDQSEFEQWLKRDAFLALAGLPADDQFAEDGTLASSLLSQDDGAGELAFLPVEISEVSLEFSQSLPEEMDFATETELAGYLGNFDYMNYILGARDGFTVDEAGTLSNGFSYGIVRATVTNATDVQTTYSPYSPALALGVLDEVNQQLLVARELFGTTASAALASDYGRIITLDPGQSCTVTYAYVLPQELAEAGQVVVLAGKETPEIQERIAAEQPVMIAGELDPVIAETSQLTNVQFLKL